MFTLSKCMSFLFNDAIKNWLGYRETGPRLSFASKRGKEGGNAGYPGSFHKGDFFPLMDIHMGVLKGYQVQDAMLPHPIAN